MVDRAQPSGGASAGPFRQWRVNDARGRSIRPLDPVALHLAQRHDMIERAALDGIVKEPGVRIKLVERVFFIVAAVCALAVGGLFTYALLTGDLAGARSAKTVSMLYMTALPWIIWFGVKRKRMRHVTTAMLKHSTCPHCGYNLRGLPTDDDGCNVCPECASAWKLTGE